MIPIVYDQTMFLPVECPAHYWLVRKTKVKLSDIYLDYVIKLEVHPPLIYHLIADENNF